MLRHSELSLLFKIPALDDDEPALLDASPEWFVPGLKPFLREDPEEEHDGLGLRKLIEHPEALSKAWRATTRQRAGQRVPRAKPRAPRAVRVSSDPTAHAA